VPWFDQFSIGWLLGIFACSAAAVWLAGDRLSRYANAVAKRTGLGHAFLGTILLGVLVSLPEAIFALVTALLGNPELAVNGLVGGVAMVMIVIALTDLFVGKEALSSDVQHPVVLLQGGMTLLMLVVAAAGITVGDRLLPGIGLVGIWSTALLGLYIVTLMLVRHLQRRHPWRPGSSPPDNRTSSKKPSTQTEQKLALPALYGRTAIASVVIVAAGAILAVTAEAFNEKTALGAGLIGLLFGGFSTSLPELSTTISAARLKEYELAFSDAFGTNLCSIALVFVADLAYGGGPILNEVGPFTTLAILLGAALTAIYVVGLTVRHERAMLRMGPDSIAVLVASAIGFALLVQLK